jgi:hypothetical protein
MVYFGQDGCPYCRELLARQFQPEGHRGQDAKAFQRVAINIWARPRSRHWTDGRLMREKALAALLTKQQFTPTLLFFNEKGASIYWPLTGITLLTSWARPSTTLRELAGAKKPPLPPTSARHAREPASDAASTTAFF